MKTNEIISHRLSVFSSVKREAAAFAGRDLNPLAQRTIGDVFF